MKSPRYRPFWLCLAWSWCAFIWYLSLTNRPPQGPEIPHLDKIGHFIAYAILMLPFPELYPGKRESWRYALGFIAMGIAIEFIQRSLGWRSFEVADMAADALGVGLGLWMGLRLKILERLERISG